MSQGKTLRLEFTFPTMVHWTNRCQEGRHDAETRDTTLGVHVVDLPTEKLAGGTTIMFTFYRPQIGRWENINLAHHGPSAAGEMIDVRICSAPPS